MKVEGGRRKITMIQVGHNSMLAGMVVMATVQKVAQSSVSASPINYGLSKENGGGGGDAVVSDQFPEGLRVLVVDDDTTCLRIIEQMLRRCLYHEAVPKRILELMNVPGLTRENVASHLQKFRLYLKRLSGVAQQQTFPNIYCGPFEQNVKLDSFGVETLAVPGQIPPQTLAAMPTELFGRPTGNLLPPMDQAAVLQASSQGPKLMTIEHDPVNPFSQTLVKRQTNDSKTYPASIICIYVATSGYSGAWPSNSLSVIGPNNHVRISSQDSNMLVGIMQEQQPHKQYQEWQQQQKLHPH